MMPSLGLDPSLPLSSSNSSLGFHALDSGGCNYSSIKVITEGIVEVSILRNFLLGAGFSAADVPEGLDVLCIFLVGIMAGHRESVVATGVDPDPVHDVMSSLVENTETIE